MKRMAITAVLITLLSSFVFAVPFAPNVMKLKAVSVIQYNFDGKELSIPVEVSGAPAAAVFFVFTKDKSATIQNIRNGFLGWHYVNKVDTCVYMSNTMQFGIGKNVITWNGNDSDNKVVPSLSGLSIKGAIKYQPDDWRTVYRVAASGATTLKLLKFKYVPQGICEQNGKFDVSWTQLNNRIDLQIDKNYAYVGENNYKETSGQTYLHVIDYSTAEGSYETSIDLTDWFFTPGDYEVGGQMNGGLTTCNIREGLFYASAEHSCQKLVFDLNAWLDGEDFNDTVRWMNTNGDYIYDHNYEADSQPPWVCNDFNVPPWSDTWPSDSNGFNTQAAWGVGAVSFSLMAPDGTGVSYYIIAGETAGNKPADLIVDNGSSFDGFYVPAAQEDWSGENMWTPDPGIWYVAMDSIKGIITNQVNVESTTPAGFSVAQNTPNQFNPATTIGFTIPAASHVTIDVFDVAGQKVNTIVNDYLPQGNHSVVWDAAGFSTGVYFYTVRAGDVSKTMKMTLLK